jgi:hypothetical protein
VDILFVNEVKVIIYLLPKKKNTVNELLIGDFELKKKGLWVNVIV